MLGQPMSMLIPRVIGFKLSGELREGATATDLVLTVTEMLREHGVVGQFVEFYGAGHREPAARRPRDDRQHVAGVRLDLRDLPDRRRDAALPRVLRPLARACRARRDLRPRAGHVARRGRRGADLLRDARARPRRGRAVARRPEAPAGPRLADRGQGVVPAGARGPRRAGRTPRPTRGPRSRSRPPTRRPRTATPRTTASAEPAGAGTGGAQVAERVSEVVAAHARRRHRDRARPRPRRDRRDHVVHEHVEPVGDDRRRPARPQRGRARAAVQAVGQDVARARLEGRHGVLRRGGPDRAARGARLPPRRLRLHDVHRQLRPAARGGLRRRQRRGPRGRLRALAATATSRAGSTPT